MDARQPERRLATPEYVNDATFWPSLPCQERRADVVPFCLDAGVQTSGACEQHIALLLKRLVVEQQLEVLVIRNVPVGPLPPHWDEQGAAYAEQPLDEGVSP